MSVYGREMNLMSNSRFRLMACAFAVRDVIAPHDYKLNSFGIKNGDTVVDCGCGTGSCLRKASVLVGEAGTVYAVDVHDMALAAALRIGVRCKNIHAVKAEGYSIPLPDSTADCVYALDMFHMVSEPEIFLKELRRITKSTGRLVIEDGHQPRSAAKLKLLQGGLWRIVEENRNWMICVPA